MAKDQKLGKTKKKSGSKLAAPMKNPSGALSASGRAATKWANPPPNGLGFKKGGKVDNAKEERGESAAERRREAKAGDDDNKMKKGGKVKKYADGGFVKMPSTMQHKCP